METVERAKRVSRRHGAWLAVAIALYVVLMVPEIVEKGVPGWLAVGGAAPAVVVILVGLPEDVRRLRR
ncbi:hypothetical protein C475_08937 [Halosimplex carlsbadense 2-9-1]|uniref:Uncharacterized protein n=2 Tax=Halosimplex carlsbadense TaxID=171164 RepID=M0CXE8_9EURY|nr:hypothetical protein C475_08937 [Halosimplex carlsbadense 2-9-1]